MKSIKQRAGKRKYKNAVFVIIFVIFTLISGIYPLIDWGNIKEKPKPIWYDPDLADYLYEDNVSQTNYSFNAMNESYIMCEIQNTDYTNLKIKN